MRPYLLHQLLSDSAQRHPGRDAVACHDRSITYAELHHASDRLASSLKELGVHPGDRVGILLNKTIESLVLIFGILKAGAAYVPIDPLAPRNRVEYILANCGIRILFASREGTGRILPFPAGGSLETIVVVGGGAGEMADRGGRPEVLAADELPGGGASPIGPFDFSDTNPAYILHTSGSTGMPKGVGLSHRNALTFVDMAADYFRVGKEDRLACHAPLPFDLTVFDIFVAIRNGATVVLVPESLSIFPAQLSRFIEEAGITVWNSVASVLSLLAERGRAERFRFDSLRAVIFSGDVLPVKHLRKLKSHMHRAQFYNVYGQTEANSSMCYAVGEVPEEDGWRTPIGKAFPNFEVFALDEMGEVIRRPGEIGELYVRGNSVAMGYWGEPERTSESFVTDPGSRLSNRKVYRTGDQVALDPDGNYLFLGRKDHQVKSRGYRIQLGEIESVLNGHPSVKEAVVLPVPDEWTGNRILSYVVTADGTALTEMELFDYCGRVLPGYMVPERCVFRDRLPKTSTGKIDRKSLLESARKDLP